MIKMYKLNNKITVVEDEITSAESFTLLIMFKTGSRNETADIWGISHFLEHMAFKGTPTYPTAELLNKELDSLGAIYNAFTSKEYTGYYIKGSQRVFEKALQIVTEMTTSPIIEETEVDRERGTVVEEINMYEDDPRRKISDNFEEGLYKNKQIAQNVIGTKESLTGIHAKQIKTYRNRYYVSENMYISVSGAVPIDLKSQLNKLFAHVEKGAVGYLEATSHEVKSINIEYKETQQTHLSIGFPGLAINDPRIDSARLLSVILGGNMSSRMFSEVREKRGLAYYIRTYNDNMSDDGFLATFAGVNNEKVYEAIEVIKDVYKKVRNDITEEELKRAKDYVSGILTLQYEDSEYRSETNAYMALYGEPLLSLAERLANIDKVTLNDVINLANNVIDFEKICLSLIGPFKSEAKFAKILEVQA